MYVYLVRQNTYSDPFIAFSDYGSAYQVAKMLAEPDDAMGAAKLILQVPCFRNYQPVEGCVLEAQAEVAGC